MKLFQLNFLTVLLLILVGSVAVLIPSLFIQSVWNSMFENFDARDVSIAVWQASLLWGSLLCVLYMTGIFKFKIDFKTLDSIDLDQINDPQLRDKIEKLREEEKNNEKK